MARGRFAFVAVLAASLVGAGCNAILGNNPGQLASDGGTSSDSTVSGDGANPGDACCSPQDSGTQGMDSSGCVGPGCNPQPDGCTANCNPNDSGMPPSDSGMPPQDSGQPPVCDGAACNPTAIATGQATPYAIAIDTTTVYFTNNGYDGGSMNSGGVASVPIGGGSVNPLVQSLKNPTDIALDTNSVYWISHDSMTCTNGCGDIATVAKTGGSPAFVQQGIDDELNRLVVYGGNFFYALNFFGDIFEQQLGVLNPIQLASNLQNIGGMQVDPTGIYAAVGGDPGSGTTAILAQVQTDAGGAVIYDYGTDRVLGGLAIDDTYVYYTNASDGTVDKLPKAPLPPPSQPTVLAIAQNNPSQIAVDSGFVYWTTQGTAAANYNDGTVMMVSKTGLPTQTIQLASGQKAPRGIAVDAVNVYWTNMGDGTVMQRAK